MAASASLHQCGPAQRWRLAVEEPVAQAGDPVQPWGDGLAEEVTGSAALGHGDTDELGELDHGAGVWLALDLVGVEHGLGQVAGEHASDLPAEVHGVADTGAEPLSDERRRQVGSVTEEEDVAVSPAVGQLRPEVVLRDACQLQLVARDALDPRSDQWLEGFDGLEVSGGLALEETELPAVPGAHRSACRSRRGPGRRPGARPPTGRARPCCPRRSPASAART